MIKVKLDCCKSNMISYYSLVSANNTSVVYATKTKPVIKLWRGPHNASYMENVEIDSSLVADEEEGLILKSAALNNVKCQFDQLYGIFDKMTIERKIFLTNDAVLGFVSFEIDV